MFISHTKFVFLFLGTDDGKDFPAEMLHNIFNRIQKNEFSTGADHMTQLKQIEQSFIGKVPVCLHFEILFGGALLIESLYRIRCHMRFAMMQDYSWPCKPT